MVWMYSAQDWIDWLKSHSATMLIEGPAGPKKAYRCMPLDVYEDLVTKAVAGEDLFPEK